MKFNPTTLGFAFAAAFAAVWVICSLLVMLFPGFMMAMTGHMGHANMEGLSWTLTPGGVILGLISWAVWGWLLGWLIGFFYNRFAK